MYAFCDYYKTNEHNLKEVTSMKFRRSGKQLDTETATVLYKCRSFSIMKNNNNSLFYIQKLRGRDPERTSSYKVRYVTNEEAQALVREQDPDVEFQVFEDKTYDVRLQLDKTQNRILFEMAYDRKVDKYHMLMEIIDKSLCDYVKKKEQKESRRKNKK